MLRQHAVAVLAAGLLLGGGAAVAVGLGTGGEPTAPVAGPSAAPVDEGVPAPEPTPTTSPSSGTTAPSTALPEPTASPHTQPDAGSDTDAGSDAATETVAPPERVRIPAIDVRSDLLHLGLDDDGAIEVPSGKDIDRAAWFDGSPRPGQDGPAVIEGHVDSPNGASVFYRLSELEPGQEVHVDRRDGTTVTFVVDRVEQYAKDEFPTRQVYANTDGPELRVITCGGDWDASVGHYEDNTVVYAHEA